MIPEELAPLDGEQADAPLLPPTVQLTVPLGATALGTPVTVAVKIIGSPSVVPPVEVTPIVGVPDVTDVDVIEAEAETGK
jgi:hypothetical protein